MGWLLHAKILFVASQHVGCSQRVWPITVVLTAALLPSATLQLRSLEGFRENPLGSLQGI